MDKKIKLVVDELKKYEKVMAIILFGSTVTGKTKPLSDIDIAVIIKNQDKTTETEVAGFSSQIFDVSPFHRLPLYIQFEVLKNGKPLWVRDENYFLEIKQKIIREYLDNVHLYERVSKKVLA